MEPTQQPRFHASDLLMLPDSEFESFMRELFSSEQGTMVLDLRSLVKLPPKDREKARQRVYDWYQSSKSKSTPIDLNQVNARLLEAMAKPRTPQVSGQPSYVTTPDEKEGTRTLETLSYEYLISDGGRPWYPIHLYDQSVTLDKEPKDQDPLTTCIEYLNFEYWNYDKAAKKLEKLRPQYDAALAELLDSGVLLPGETPESVSDPFFVFALGDQLAMRERAVESGKAMVAEAEKTPCQNAALKQATAYLQRAIQAAEAVRKRCDHIRKFSSIHNKYHSAKRETEAEQAKAQWALDQVPLVEKEMTELSQKDAAQDEKDSVAVVDKPGAQKEDIAGSGPHLQDTPGVSPISNDSPTMQSGRKRARNDDSEDVEQPGNKMRKLDHNSERSTSPPQRTTRSTHELQELSKSGDALAESSEPQLERAIRVLRSSTKAKKFETRNDAAPLRRSARIAALKEKAAQEASKGKHHEDLVKRSSRKISSKRRAAGVKKREPPKTKEAEEKRVTRRQPRKRL
ncbi:hypothetical protein VTJ04DRAFT_849 [Mycothermus thermophilus]|uniref:uncharacterized protein n=1 Tax=Humicola insolens TaxID=85995 RepID=UPI0037447F41